MVRTRHRLTLAEALAELHTRARAWRDEEIEALAQHEREHAHDCRVRAQALEQVAVDLEALRRYSR